jgi:hypothetical protein
VLAHSEKTFGWSIDRDALSRAGLLAPVLWSAGDLIVSPEVGRLRHCLNDQCGWLFMDDSKERQPPLVLDAVLWQSRQSASSLPAQQAEVGSTN